MPFAIRKKFIEAADFGPLKIRLQRFGKARFPFYNIVVAQSRHRRNGKAHDHLGTYTPVPTNQGYKHICLDMEKTKHWLSVGASPTTSCAMLLSKAGLIPSMPRYHERAAVAEKLQRVLH